MSVRAKKPKPPTRRKEDHVQLHDEADLVNFRADALGRFVSNQDYLENVVSKPFHTSKIEPPLPFPITPKPGSPDQKDAEKSLQKDTQTDQLPKENDQASRQGSVAAEPATPASLDVFVGGIPELQKRLETAVASASAAEAEAAGLSRDSVFDAEMRFQHEAAARLAEAQARFLAGDDAAVAELETVLAEVQDAYTAKFQRTVSAGLGAAKIHLLPLEAVAPGLEVARAPAQYDPHLIGHFLPPKEPSAAVPGPAQSTGQHSVPGPSQQPPNGHRYGDDDDFGMMMDKADPSTHDMPMGMDSVNMDELNQFLANPDDADMNDMDALMDFDQQDTGGMEEDFNV